MILAEEGGAAILFPIWQEMLVGAIAFGLLCFVLMKFVFPRMEKTFEARVDAIEGGIERAETAQEEANQTLEEYRRKLEGAQSEAAAIRDEARADAVAAKEEILVSAREEANRIIAAGHAQIEASRQQLVRELRSEVGNLAVDLAGKIIGQRLADDASTTETVDQFLAQMETESSGAR
ncbi:F0F1 ATP synthase subunit B [Glycomyces buryatensis]|uniref:ATP synthase subunit b n=1 Tax=Glycomyces buryatensis TaxID=2570927 RepID=A0A4S8QE77_9ACTN|nr:F0F1 ATP synthase subunit B [Glycomyces buryatensis]THV42893.1 F0F1 ATP synthase subunit B [Glycomyces buryatensis]